MESIQIQNIYLAEFKEIIQQNTLKVNKDLAIDSFLNKFENTVVTSSFLKELWKVDADTITSYIKNNVIKPINPGAGKYLFNAKDILSMENPKWRRIGK